MDDLRQLHDRMLDAAMRVAAEPFSGGGLSFDRIGGEAIDVWSPPRGAATLELRVMASRKGAVDRVLFRSGREVPLRFALARAEATGEFQVGQDTVETRCPDPGLVAWLRLMVQAAVAVQGGKSFRFEPPLPPA